MSKYSINEAVVFITGANRGIGRAFATMALESGAKKVYAGSRRIEALAELQTLHGDRLVPVELDVTQDEQVEKAAKKAGDTTVLINNAGVLHMQSILSMNDLNAAYHEMEVNYFGVIKMIRAFASILKSNGGGALCNVGSIVSHVNMPTIATYSASKAAVHSITQAARAELAAQKTAVFGIYPGPIETDMTKDMQMSKESPNNVAKTVYESMAEGEEEIFTDAFSQSLWKSIQADSKAVEKQMAGLIG